MGLRNIIAMPPSYSAIKLDGVLSINCIFTISSIINKIKFSHYYLESGHILLLGLLIPFRIIMLPGNSL